MTTSEFAFPCFSLQGLSAAEFGGHVTWKDRSRHPPYGPRSRYPLRPLLGALRSSQSHQEGLQ